MANSDLHFLVKFADGSVWDSVTDHDQFKRVYNMHPSTLELVPSPLYKNSFMDGPDEMPARDIKKAFIKWLTQHNPDGYTIKWKYSN